jgi:hypothetical protein
MTETLKKLLNRYWWVPVILILVVLIAWVIYLSLTGYTWPAWTGFSDYTGPLTKDQRGKTLWDWDECQ